MICISSELHCFFELLKNSSNTFRQFLDLIKVLACQFMIKKKWIVNKWFYITSKWFIFIKFEPDKPILLLTSD